MIKFTDIRRNANVLLGHEKETAIIKHSQVVGYIVPVERMEELLSAEEQFENGYMVQKNDNTIKAGDTVRIKSLDNTYKSYGYGDDMKEVSELAIVEEIDGCQVWFKLDAYSYHIDDLELVK